VLPASVLALMMVAATAAVRIGSMSATMVTGPIADTVQMKRLTEFAADVLELADERADLELRDLLDALHADLLELKDEDR
jgi:hypothetical protein